jgi:hypothetical protein
MVRPVFTSVMVRGNIGNEVFAFPRRIAAVMPDGINLEGAGGHAGVFEPGKDRDGAAEEADGLGTRGSADFYYSVWFN